MAQVTIGRRNDPDVDLDRLHPAKTHGSLEQKQAAINQTQEELAAPLYKPSRIHSEKRDGYFGLDLRARGTALRELFAPPWSWHTKTFVSATGNYGWLEYSAPGPYYVIMAAGYLTLLAVYVWAVVRSREVAVGLGFLFVATFAALTVAVAIYHSWFNDFQAQGRYLFPIVAMRVRSIEIESRKAGPSGSALSSDLNSCISHSRMGAPNPMRSTLVTISLGRRPAPSLRRISFRCPSPILYRSGS